MSEQSASYETSEAWKLVIDAVNRNKQYVGKLSQLQADNEKVLGNISYYREKCETFDNVVIDLKPKVVVEVGLNCGHSAAIILARFPDVKFFSFDLADRLYIREVAAEFTSKYPGFKFFPGDSNVTVPTVSSEIPDDVDLVFIDGDHTYKSVSSDIKHLAPKLRVGGVVIVDDTEIGGIARAVNESVLSSPSFVCELSVNALRFTRDRKSSLSVFRRVA
jgi:predicted O-methyltransferase YrrM